MQQVDEAVVFQAVRYQEAYRAEGRRNHHRIVPGSLVAELLRYIENSLPDKTQRELELDVLVSESEKGGNDGAQWRAYVAHRERDCDEKKVWRAWYGKYGQKDGLRLSVNDDPFAIQTLPLPVLDADEALIPPASQLSRPLMRGLPQDGKPMKFETIRDVIKRWAAIIIQQSFKQAACLDEADMTHCLAKSLLRVHMCLHPILTTINVWEAANQALACEVMLNVSDVPPLEFTKALAEITEREERKQQKLIDYWESWL